MGGVEILRVCKHMHEWAQNRVIGPTPTLLIDLHIYHILIGNQHFFVECLFILENEVDHFLFFISPIEE
jgi:hypothetical protein